MLEILSAYEFSDRGIIYFFYISYVIERIYTCIHTCFLYVFRKKIIYNSTIYVNRKYFVAIDFLRKSDT